MSSRPEAKANAANGRTRKKQRFYPLAPEPKAKRARPENPSLGLEALLAGPSCWTSDAAEALLAFGQMASLAIEEVPNLQEMWTALEAVGSSLSSDAGGAALRRLPDLLGAAAVDGASEGLRSHLEKGGAIEALPLPTRAQGNGSASSEAFRWLHERVEAELDAAIQGKRDIPSLQWLETVAMFYGRLRPGPPLPRNVLEDSADLALRAVEKSSPLEAEQLTKLSRVALGAALSGTLGCHPIYGRVASAAAAALDGGEASTRLSSSTIHDVSLTLALLQPWNMETEEQVARFRSSVAKNVLPKAESAPAGSEVIFLGASSVAGLRNGEPKENQDTFHAHVDGSVATIAVVDGHGKRGQILSAAARDGIAKALAELKGGAGASEELAEVIMTVDADLLIHEKAEVEAELSGATCAVLRVEGLGHAERRLALAHLGDCRAVLGRVRPTNGTGSLTWTTVRLTEDHRPGEAAEAARLVAAGGRVQKMPGPAGVDPAMLGPPRLWHRLKGQAPGLAMSRGLGDTLGKACGLSPEATAHEMMLVPKEDVVLVVGSDGVFDVLSDAEVLHCCRQFIDSQEATKAAEVVTASARRVWQQRGAYVDDCTCVVLFL